MIKVDEVADIEMFVANIVKISLQDAFEVLKNRSCDDLMIEKGLKVDDRPENIKLMDSEEETSSDPDETSRQMICSCCPIL